MGNLLTDAFVHMYQKHPDETAWADVSIAMWVSGGIRSSIDKKINGNLAWLTSYGMFYYVMNLFL